MAKTCTKKAVPLLALLLGIAAFHVVTMPNALYPGDAFAPRAACASLLTKGEIGIDYANKPAFGGFLENRGQYLYENDAKQKMYSKYGIGNTLMYMPPMLAEKLYTGKLQLLHGTKSLVVILNVYLLLLTLVVAAYLYSIVSLYTWRTWLRVGFVLASFYGTFVWHYLRAPALEIFQIPLFLGCFYHAIRFFRGAGEEQRPWGHLTAAVLLAGALVFLKPFFALLVFTVCLFAALAGPAGVSPVERVRRNATTHLVRYILYLALPAAVVVALFLWVNHYKFGSPFESGYGQWMNKRTGLQSDHLDPAIFPTSFSKFFFIPGNVNALTHFPLFLFGLFGLWRFGRKHGFETAFMGFIFITNLVAICFFTGWTGAWCYAPRYLIHILMIGSLPFVETCEWLLTMRVKVVKYAAAAVICLVLLWSAQMQWYMNSLHFFAFYNARGFFQQFKNERMDNYFKDIFHRGMIHRSLIEYRKKGAPFYPLQVLDSMLPPEQKHVLGQVRPYLLQIARPGFLFFEE